VAEPDSLQLWRTHPQDYVVICRSRGSTEGEGLAYQIVNLSKKLTHTIENQATARKLAQEMLDAVVRLVTLEEARRLIGQGTPRQQG
jgi:hypothetical protein